MEAHPGSLEAHLFSHGGSHRAVKAHSRAIVAADPEQWRFTLVLERLTLKLQRLTMELWRLTLKP
jgi:hypothetical protein